MKDAVESPNPSFQCSCGATRRRVVKLEDGPHYAAETCWVCNRWKRWLPKPSPPHPLTRSPLHPRNRPAAHRNLVKKYSRGFCELCLTPERQLRQRNWLEAHHVLEYAAGGVDSRENVWIVCRSCHRLICWVRSRGEERRAK